MLEIKIVKGDITKIKADAIVNAANETLLGGGGVDGAIHKAAGKKLFTECKKLGGCETGNAKVTKAYQLPSKIIIHAVGPRWRGGGNNEEKLLEKVYLKSLELAEKHRCRSISFPAISTGIFSFPLKRATEIATNAVREFSLDKKNNYLEKVIFVCFDEKTFQTYLNYKKKNGLFFSKQEPLQEGKNNTIRNENHNLLINDFFQFLFKS